MKTAFRIIVILVVVLAVVLAARNVIVKFVVEKGVEAATGLPLNIQKLDLGLSATHIEISGLNLLSSKEFNNEVMFSSPEIFVDYDLGAILRGKIHLEDIRLDFERLVIIKNKEGNMNLDALKPKTGEEGKEAPAQKPKEGGAQTKAEPPRVKIDHLEIKVGKIIYKDYSQGPEPVIKEYNVNISEEMNNVTDPQNLLGVIAAQAMAKTALTSLGDFNIDAFKGELVVPEEAVNMIKNQVDALKGIIKFPFGE